jgi:hypothetical protein
LSRAGISWEPPLGRHRDAHKFVGANNKKSRPATTLFRATRSDPPNPLNPNHPDEPFVLDAIPSVRSSLVALKPHEHTTAKGVLAEFRELGRADEMTLESGEFLDNISHTRYKEIS